MRKQRLQQFEFIVLMASFMSLTAMVIDTILPALDIIGATLGSHHTYDQQLLITMVFLGLGIGPLFFGPLSDSIGRKPAIFLGCFVFFLR